MRYFSMFSGIGGFELGLQRSCIENKRQPKVLPLRNTKGQSKQQPYRSTERFTCIGYSEINKYAIQVYQKHFPTHKNYGDATKLNTRDLPDFDFLVAGFPCQAFSIAGKRKGFQDTRGTLFFEIARVLADKRPRYFLLENVKGLLSHQSGKTFQTILRVLTDIGYVLQWEVLNSKNFGVPQNRERVFIIGCLGGKGFRQVFPVRKGTKKNDMQIKRIASNNIFRRYNQTYDKTGIIESLDTHGGGGHQPCVLSPCIRAEHHNTADVHFIPKDMKIRRLTPIECERLQGFPDGWTEGLSDTQRYKCLGNAVTVNVIEAIIERFVKV